MQAYLRKQIDWPQAFPPEEYRARVDRVRAALAERGVDALYVTTPANITWLTGYDMIWYHPRNLTGLLVRADSADTVFFDGTAHTTLVSTTPEIREVVWFERAPAGEIIRIIAEAIASRGLATATIALEKWGYAPHATIMEALESRLREGGATVVDQSLLVEELRLVKSPLELEHVRRAARLADQAMAVARDAIRPGVSETELEGVIMGTMMKAGGGYPAIRTMIGTGPRSGTHHAPPSQRRIKQGDLVFIDFCGCYHRYHVNLNRTFSLGPPDPRWVELMDKAAGSIDAIVAGVRPGDPLGKVQAIGDAYIDRVGLRRYVWYVGGYSLGIAVPPDWVGHHRFQAPPGVVADDLPFEPGMVLNFENQFDVWEDWPGGSGAAYIETLLMTESGIEVLSELPRTLVAV